MNNKKKVIAVITTAIILTICMISSGYNLRYFFAQMFYGGVNSIESNIIFSKNPSNIFLHCISFILFHNQYINLFWLRSKLVLIVKSKFIRFLCQLNLNTCKKRRVPLKNFFVFCHITSYEIVCHRSLQKLLLSILGKQKHEFLKYGRNRPQYDIVY